MQYSLQNLKQLDGAVIFNVQLNGTNEKERDWIISRTDQYGTETVCDICDYVFVVSNTTPQRVLQKFKGGYRSLMGNIIHTECYSYENDRFDEYLYNVKTAR